MKLFHTPSWSLDADDDRNLRKAATQKAQSGVFADAVRANAEAQRAFAIAEPSLTDAERSWLLEDAELALRRAKRQHSCAKHFNRFVRTVGPDTTEIATVQKSYFCKRPTCAVCAVRAARKLYQRVLTRYDVALTRIPELVALHLTLTQPAVAQDLLGPAIDRLHRAVRTFLRTPAITQVVEGSFRRTEIAWNDDQQHWHVHAHLILLVRGPYHARSKRWLAHQQLMELWARKLGLTGWVSVNIKLVYDRHTKARDADGVRAGLIHVAKYLCKPAGLFTRDADGTYSISPELAAALSDGVFKRRTYAFSGVFASRWKPKPSG